VQKNQESNVPVPQCTRAALSVHTGGATLSLIKRAACQAIERGHFLLVGFGLGKSARSGHFLLVGFGLGKSARSGHFLLVGFGLGRSARSGHFLLVGFGLGRSATSCGQIVFFGSERDMSAVLANILPAKPVIKKGVNNKVFIMLLFEI
jgi:hypothetical protein